METKEEKVINLIRKLRWKEDFKIPDPKPSEEEKIYIERCMYAIGGEFPPDQAYAICKKTYDER